MDAEMDGVVARIQEFINDLSAEYQKHIDNPEVTERAKNLFHEVLVKMRSALDMTMYRIWKKYAPPYPTPEKMMKAAKGVYFPICDTSGEFNYKLKDICPDLETRNPSLHALLLQSQPFSTGRPAMSELRDLSNLGKHVRLAQQTRKSRPATRARRTDGSTIIIAPPLVTESDMRERMGGEIDLSTIETVNWIEFSVDGHDLSEPTIFCLSLFTGLQTYLTKLLSHV
jgi:hypothetical protein